MTTDLYPKVRRAQLGVGSIVGIAKGAGMVEPNMATMLCYLLTDIAVPRDELRRCLGRAVATSFNAISIDSDQSTSDSVVLLSSGKVPCQSEANFAQALEDVCRDLAADVVRNGEGVRHVIQVLVVGARDVVMAKGVGKSVVNSPLVQCAVCGNDPNVGRILMAVGKYLGNYHPGIDVSRCRIGIGGVEVFADGVFRLDPAKEELLRQHLLAAELYRSAPPDANGVFLPPVDWPRHERCVEIRIDLGCGQACFEVTGADRTHEYISENADYRT
jgi:glutamate N-acetyltransferase/amino-acid N-acetyltransferase